MLTYNNFLKMYANVYNGLKFHLFNIAVSFGLPKYVERLKMAELAEMVARSEMLIDNINKCQYFFELQACKDHYRVLCLSYPNFYHDFSDVIMAAIARRELIIKQSFTQ